MLVIFIGWKIVVAQMVQNSIFKFREIFIFSDFFSYSDILYSEKFLYSETFLYSVKFLYSETVLYSETFLYSDKSLYARKFFLKKAVSKMLRTLSVEQPHWSPFEVHLQAFLRTFLRLLLEKGTPQ